MNPVFYVVIPTSGSPLFLRHQIRLLRIFSDDVLRIIVVNDAKETADPSNWWDPRAVENITAVCAELQVEVLRYPQHRHSRRLRPPRISSPSARTGEAIQFGFDAARKRQDCARIAVIDSDMFPFARFSFSGMLGDNAMAMIQQTRYHRWFKRLSVRYPWNGFLLMDLPKLPRPETMNFGPGLVNGLRTDTGGKLHPYLAAHPRLAIKRLNHLGSSGWRADDVVDLDLPDAFAEFVRNDPANRGGAAFSEIYERRFLHFRAGGNWQSVLGDTSDLFSQRHRQFSAALERIGQA